MPKVILENVRCVHLYVTEKNKEHDNYSAQILIDKADKEQFAKITAAQKEAYKEGLAAGKLLKTVDYENTKKCLRDGNEKSDKGEFYESCYFVNANSKDQPGLVNKQVIVPDEDELAKNFYPGAYFNVSLTIHAYHKKEKSQRGIRAELNNLMLLGGGKRLSGKAPATEDFKDFSAAAEDFSEFDDL